MAEAPTLRYLDPLTLGDTEGCHTGLQPRGTLVRGVGGGKEPGTVATSGNTVNAKFAECGLGELP
jgi:hypothetical protein